MKVIFSRNAAHVIRTITNMAMDAIRETPLLEMTTAQNRALANLLEVPFSISLTSGYNLPCRVIFILEEILVTYFETHPNATEANRLAVAVAIEEVETYIDLIEAAAESAAK